MKKKMSNRRFMSIWIPIVSVMVVLAIGANIAGSVFGGILDTSLGRGERHVLHLENVANWDTEYYPQQYTTLAQAREAAERKMYEVVSEGMVLLKNDGVLPLEKGSLVTPFGRGYAHPIYNFTTAMRSAAPSSIPPRRMASPPGRHWSVSLR